MMAVLRILVTTVLYRGSYSSVRGQKTISYAAPKPIIKIARMTNWRRKHEPEEKALQRYVQSEVNCFTDG